MKVLLYYKYTAVADPTVETETHRSLCEELGLRGRILIGAEGINGTCSGTPENIEKYKAALNAHPLFRGIAFKESEYPGHVFKKLFVRCRREIVALHTDTKPENAAPYVTAEQLHAELERGEDLVLVDMRNDYEAEIGRFRNAVTLPVKNFREIPAHLPELSRYKERKVVTYCTGGIRCEKASAFLRDSGFTNVRQLEGGIVKYCEAFPDGYFDGGLFVFDERRSVRFPGARKPSYVSECGHCKAPSDRYIDCAIPTCHELFVCCEACEKNRRGLCETHAVEEVAV